MNSIEKLHGGYVQGRRVRVLSDVLARHIPPDARVLDVGAGDGQMALAIKKKRPDLEIRGLDVHERSCAHVPIEHFDGKSLPDTNSSYDVVMFVDVLHHTETPFALLKEAMRVTRRSILIKDHIASGRISYKTLRFMDRVGNERYGVALPYNYWWEQQWWQAFAALGLVVSSWSPWLGLYPWPASLIFDRGLHFVAVLEKLGPAETRLNGSSPASIRSPI